MALLFIDGFDTGADPAWAAPPTITAGGRTGPNCGTTTALTTRIAGFTPSATAIFGAAARFPLLPVSTSFMVPSFMGDSGVTHHMRVGVSASGNLVARRGTTDVATSTQQVTPGVWYYIEAKCTVADTGGIFVVRVNGVEWLNFTGDTKNAGTATNIDAVGFSSANASTNFDIDDMYVCNGLGATCNDFLGDHKVETLLPSGNGASSQFLGNDGNSTDNYLLVDEQPANSTDWVASSTIGQRDLYQFADLVTSSGVVRGVQPVFHAQKSDAGAASVIDLARDTGGTVDSGTAKTLSTTWATVPGKLRETKPGGGAWSIADVNAAQFGAEVA